MLYDCNFQRILQNIIISYDNLSPLGIFCRNPTTCFSFPPKYVYNGWFSRAFSCKIHDELRLQFKAPLTAHKGSFAQKFQKEQFKVE